jgi:hypothetical protein
MTKRSYDLKAQRADVHLRDMENAVSEYVGTHPYEVRAEREGKRRVHRIVITEQPSDDVALMLGDFVHNARSALDHLAASLVPAGRRSSTSFPIFFKGVWEAPVVDEDKQRTKDRERWVSITKGMEDDAVEILKSTQPPDTFGDPSTITHSLVALNRIWNRDKHERLAVVAATLLDVRAEVLDPDTGCWRSTTSNQGRREGLPDGALLTLPAGGAQARFEATPAVTVRFGGPGSKEGYEIPGSMRMAFRDVQMTIDALRRFDRRTTD